MSDYYLVTGTFVARHWKGGKAAGIPRVETYDITVDTYKNADELAVKLRETRNNFMGVVNQVATDPRSPFQGMIAAPRLRDVALELVSIFVVDVEDGEPDLADQYVVDEDFMSEAQLHEEEDRKRSEPHPECQVEHVDW